MKDITINENSVIIIENKSSENISFRYFGVNFSETLAPEDKVILTPASSEVAAYYLALKDDIKGLDVTQSEADANSDEEPATPVVEPEEPVEPEPEVEPGE